MIQYIVGNKIVGFNSLLVIVEGFSLRVNDTS